MPIAVGVGALVNIGLNFLLIHLMSIEGAAIASVVGEIVVFGVYLAFSHKYFHLRLRWKNLLKILLGLVIMTGYLLLIYFLIDNLILKICLEIAGAIVIYFVSLLIMKEDALISGFRKVFHR
jgi:O-antigen/teichoic acid export membrane protein